jgi:glycosyltransferase involved in cell wall biosynthesis
MQRVAANSGNVRARLRRYLGLEDVHVIHPPVNTETWQWIEQGDYYLSNARLEPYKRVDRVVRAFMAMPDRKLVVTSGGSQLDALRKLADGCHNIHFTGWTSPGELRDLVGRCIATVYLARDEDFGMAPVESMAAGKPVIGVDEGGLRETIVHGDTGWLIELGDDESVDDLIDAVRRLEPEVAFAMRPACERRAQAFRGEVFDAALDRFVEGDS